MGKPLTKDQLNIMLGPSRRFAKRGVITQSNKPIAALDTKGAAANNSISVSPTLPPKPIAVQALGTPLGMNSSSFDNAIDRYNQSDRMLNTGRQGFAETYARYADPTTPPVISNTPYITGPQINRDTGEITQNPLTWMLTGDDMGNFKPTNPVGPVDPPKPPVPPVGPIDPVGPINQVEPPNYDDTGTGIVRYDVENIKPIDYEIETPEGYGWGTPLGDFRFYEDPGMTNPPAETRPGVGPVPLPSGDRDGERPLEFRDPVVIRHPRPLQGEPNTTTDGDTTTIENATPFKGPYKQTDGSFQEIAGSVLGGIESMTDAVLGKTQFDQYPRPESEKFVARKAGKLNDLMKGYGAEMFEWWETQGVPAALSDRTPFGPDYGHSLKNLGKIIENKDNIKTQEYGKAQFLAILNTANMIAAVGPMAAIPPAVVTLSKEIMAGLKNSLADHPELRGNPIQDVIHGTTWVLGKTLEKTYNKTLGNLTGKIDDAKLKEKLSKLNISEMMKTPEVPTGVKITIDPNKPRVDHLKPQNDPLDLGTTEQKLVSGTPVTASREMRKPQPVEVGETATADTIRVEKPVTDAIGSPFVGQSVSAGPAPEVSGSLFSGDPEVSEAKTLFGPLGTRPSKPEPVEDDRLTKSQLDEGIDIQQGTVETDDVTELVDLMLGEVPTEGKFDPNYVDPDRVDPNAKREKTEGKFTEEEKKEQQKQQEELDRKQEDAEYEDKLAGEVTTPSLGRPVREFKGDVGKPVYDKDTQKPQPAVKDDKEEFKGQPVTSKVEGEVVEYDEDPRDRRDRDDKDRMDLRDRDPKVPLAERTPDDLKPLPSNENEVEFTEPTKDKRYDIQFGDGSVHNVDEETYLRETKQDENGVSNARPYIKPETLKELEDLGIKPAENPIDPYANVLAENVKVAVDQNGNVLDHTEVGFDPGKIAGFEFRNKDFPVRSKEDPADGKESANHRAEIAELEGQFESGSFNKQQGQVTDTNTDQTDSQSSDQKKYGLTASGNWKDESDRSKWPEIVASQSPQYNQKTQQFDLMYNPLLPSSMLPDHPQYYGNNPENPLNINPDVNVEYTKSDNKNDPIVDWIGQAGLPQYTTIPDFEGTGDSLRSVDRPVKLEYEQSLSQTGSGDTWQYKYRYVDRYTGQPVGNGMWNYWMPPGE